MRTSVLTCPKCGASLSPPVDERAVRCGYCGTSVVVEADGGAPRGGAPAAGSGRPAALLLLAMGVPAVVLGILALVVLTRGPARSSASTSPPEPAAAATQATPTANTAAMVAAPGPPPAAPPPAPTASAAPTEPNALADIVLEFGEKGTGPGQLDDARAIAVDPGGDIYVADYGSLRIQRFDASGKFLAAIQLERGKHGGAIPSIATTSDGHLWVSRMGELLELSLPDGKVIKTVPSQEPRLAYTGIAVDAANMVYSGNEGATTWVSVGGGGPPRLDELRKLDKNGRVLAGWKGITKGSGFGDRVAVDHEGNVYVAERLRCIDVVDPKGKLKTRFDAHGDGGIAVDGKGRIFLGTGRSVTVFDATGTTLGRIATGDVDNLTLGRDGRLYTVSRSRVRVLALR